MAHIRSNDRTFASAQFARLSPEQCEKIHGASLEILARTGARLYEPEAIELLRKAGADVAEGNRVRIPPGLVERALTTVPKQITLYGRHGHPAMYLKGNRSYYGPGSDCLHIFDHRTDERRQPVLQDVADAVTVCDALPDIDFVMSMFLPSDVNPLLSDVYQMEIMLNRTTKPLIFVTNEFAACPANVEMAEAVVGGPDALRRRPLAACYVNVAAPLRHNDDSLRKLLYLAGKGLPVLYIPVVTGGISGPITTAGSLALTNAGTLVGLVLSQLKREGAPFIAPGFQGDALDMRTMVSSYCAPANKGLANEIAHFYGLPCFGEGGMSEAKIFDEQAAAEAAATLFAATLGGVNLIHDVGYLGSGTCNSLASLVVCHEMIGWLSHFMAGLEITDETLALDLIDQVGPDGQYLDTDHTMKHFREQWYPSVLERGNVEQWQATGSRTLRGRANGRVQQILDEHRPEELPAETVAAIRAVVRRAEQTIAGQGGSAAG